MTTIFAYFFKMLINYYVIIHHSGIIKDNVNENNFKTFIYCILFIYIIPTIISFFLYLCYIRVFTKKTIKTNLDERKVRIIDFLGYLIYIEQKENKKEKIKCESCQRLFNNIYTCIKKIFAYDLFDYFCCCLDWFYGHFHCFCFDSYDYNYCCYYHCCTEFDEDYKKNETFCYCYKYTGKLSWFFNILSNEFQVLILIISFTNFFIQFITIGLIKKINNEIDKQVFGSSNFHFLTYFLTFILYLLLNHIISYIMENYCFPDSNFDNNDEDVLSSKVFGVNLIVWSVSSAIVIIVCNLFFSIIFSILHIFTKISFINNNNIILIPIILNKLFYFTQSKICSHLIGEFKSFELLSNSTTLSFYILLWNSIINLLLKLNEDILYKIQLIGSVLVILISIIFTLMACDCCSC